MSAAATPSVSAFATRHRTRPLAGSRALGALAQDLFRALQRSRAGRAADRAFVQTSKRSQGRSDGIGRLCPGCEREVSPQERLEFAGSLGQRCDAACHHGRRPGIGPHGSTEEDGDSRPSSEERRAPSDEVRGVAQCTRAFRTVPRGGDAHPRFVKRTGKLPILGTPGPPRANPPQEDGEKCRRRDGEGRSSLGDHGAKNTVGRPCR